MADDLDVLEPSGSSVTYHGERLEIKPLKIGQLPKLVRTARPVIDAVLALESLPDENSTDMVTLVMDLIEHHGDQVFEAAGVCTGKAPEWLQDGEIDEFILLAKTVFEVNRDFFDRKLVPLLGGRAAKPEKAPGSGPTRSSSSSSTTTPSAKSSATPSANSAPSAKPQPAPATASS